MIKVKNTFAIFLIVSIIILLSCSGKNGSHDFDGHGQIDAHEINLSKTFKKLTYHPKEYVATETDTLMNNGFRVKIKYYSLMDHSIRKTNRLAINQESTVFYRQFQSDIMVYKDEQLIFQTTMNDKGSAHFEKDILQFVYLDELVSSKDQVVIKYAYHDITNNQFSDHRLYIKENGTIKTEKI